MIATWDDGQSPPQYERGLPHEIHMWKCRDNIFILRDTHDNVVPTWCRWREGQAIKDCGAEFVTKEGRYPAQ